MTLPRRDVLGVLLSSALTGCRGCSEADTDIRVLTVDPRRVHQTFEGFGTALVAWRDEMVRYYQTEDFRRLYLDELGATALRIDLWEASVPPRERWQDISFSDFLLAGEGKRGGAWTGAAEHLSRLAKGRLRVLASIWTPPHWMKVNGKRGHGGPKSEAYGLLDEELLLPFGADRVDENRPARTERLHRNRLREDRYLHFAKSLVEWMRLLRKRGVSIYGLCLQNEPRFSHWFESCVYTPAELGRLHQVVVEMFEREGEEIPNMYAPETMSHDVLGNQRYLDRIFEDPKVARRIHAVATHGYLDGYASDDDPQTANKVKQIAERYACPAWVTEGGSGEHTWPSPLHSLAGGLMNSLLFGDVSLIAPWQCAADPPSKNELAGVGVRTKKTYVAAQFFRHLEPGMRRVHVDQPDGGARCVAFTDSDASRHVVIGVNPESQLHRIRFAGARGRLRAERVYLTDARRDHVDVTPRGEEELSLPEESVVTWLLRA